MISNFYPTLYTNYCSFNINNMLLKKYFIKLRTSHITIIHNQKFHFQPSGYCINLTVYRQQILKNKIFNTNFVIYKLKKKKKYNIYL